MLTRLTIENIALVDNVDLKFGPGLTALTGETGAGKSIIVTALALALGDRADREYVRHGFDSALVRAEFGLNAPPVEMPGEYRDKQAPAMLVIERELRSDGSSRARLNGKPTSLAQLKQVVSSLAEIVGQHANQMLMSEENHLLFLDRFGGLDPTREEVARIYGDWQRVAGELRHLKKRREQLVNERELLLFQKKEIEQAGVRVGEEEQLQNERRRIDSARALMTSAHQVEQLLGADDHSAASLMSLAQRELDSMASVDTSLQKQQELLSEIGFQIEELRRFVQQYGASLEDDPNRLEEVNERLDEIYTLKKKYGGSEEAVLQTLQEIHQRLGDRPDTNSLIAELEQEHEQLCRTYVERAVMLSEARARAARQLKKQVIGELKKLAIDQCDFEFEFLYEDDPAGVLLGQRSVRPNALGLESGRFLFTANPGAPLRSLVRTASGGEISRVLLALKSAERGRRAPSSGLLVFDEVDAGIGGRTAVEVGRKLKELSDNGQVLVITHLHQIARQADHHFLADKQTDRGNHTTITVRRLDKPDIAAELERMVALPQ